MGPKISTRRIEKGLSAAVLVVILLDDIFSLYVFNRYISYVYDAIRLYSEAVHEVLEEGGTIDDGRFIISKLLNKSYSSMLGFTMTLDEHGDPQGNYTLLTRQKLKRSAFDLEHGMVQTAHFIRSKSYLPSMQLADKISIPWSTPNGQPPPDMPPCGFFNELCYEDPNYGIEIVSGSLAVLTMIGFIIGFIYYRNWKYEQELAGLIWKIESKDIQFRPYNTLSMVNCGSKATVYSQESMDACYNYFGFDPSAFAIYKGSVVAIKTIIYSRKVKEISRATKIEMKKMRELHHDNVNNFLGIMIEPSCIRVVREYCAKGSLFDVLLDDNLKLDQLFIASFIEDLLKGMIYIHDSELKVHGNLKSTNCVITSRWTLQVSDFALQELRDGQEYDSEESQFYSLLWTAPELLRDDALHHPPKGTQKGDVYSFGIIFHEILSRNGPYDIYKDGHCISPKEIITNLCTESVFTFYRPNLADLELQGYMIEAMENCWEEVPQRRADFRSVRQRLKLLFKGIL
uniref:guanylate cyclase n=1 Tax=Romanomermis culicivorax TaxID=13658 RepID=A0A915KGW3_ROMCU